MDGSNGKAQPGNNAVEQHPDAMGVQLSGGAAVVAPMSAFPHGVPNNALIVLPVSKPTDELLSDLEKGAVVVTQQQMWDLLGFNGPAVQVQDDQGRPLAIGLEDLLNGLEKNWKQDKKDLNRARIYAQELLKYERHERAEKVLGFIVASGKAIGDDWMALGATQLQLGKTDKAEGSLKGAVKLLKGNPYPFLHLAKVYHETKDAEQEREMALTAIRTDRRNVDSWAYFFNFVRDHEDDVTAIAEVEKEASGDVDANNAAPYIAIQGFYASDKETLDTALIYAKKAVENNRDDPLALHVLSALYGQKGQLQDIINLLKPHEAKMMNDVRLANNYFEALHQSHQTDKVTKLLNALAGSQNPEVKNFAIERSRAIAQQLQQQQQQLMSVANPGGGHGAGRQN